MFITLEGGEGAGKSTQARLLAMRLRQVGRTVIETREPGGTPGAERLRSLVLASDPPFVPLAEMLLHVAARADHVERLIRPALAAGHCVLCDRFADSTMAYQGFAGGVDRAAIATVATMVGLEPDVTLVLDVAPAVSQARLATRGGGRDRYERMGEAFFGAVREGFLAIAAATPRCIVIDADAAPAAVADSIWRAVEPRL